MKADHLSFRRATSVALLGLGLQLGMGLALLVYAIINKDSAAFAGAMFLLAGSIVWLALAVVFDQHRRERIEALEADSLAQAGARESSVFGDRPDDLRVAAKRLAWMHKYLVPAASLFFAAVLVALGLWTFRAGRGLLAADMFSSLKEREQGWALAVGASLAIVGFLFARYVSGMSKERAWANLRAGAAQSVGAVLIGLAMIVAQLVDRYGTDAIARYLLIAIPILMFVIAAETVLNFLLGLYRPRRPGEIPRPAFESRILGFIAAPDRIAESIGGALNYQFGFDVTGSWFYQLLRRSLTALVVVGLIVMWGLTTIGVVQPNEQGLRVRFGKQVGPALQPGPYLKLPWPLERIERFDATTVRRMNLGGEAPNVRGSILWTNDHGVTENFFIVQPTGATSAGVESHAGAAAGISENDVSLIAAEVPLQFEVTDFAKYEQFASSERNTPTAPEQRELVLQGIARREVFRYLTTAGLDSVLGQGRPEISAELRRRVDAKLTELDAGVRVLHVAIEGVHPPKDTAELFEAVVQKAQESAGGVENGQREANATLIAVAGSVEAAREIVAAIDKADTSARSDAPEAQVIELQLAAESLIAKATGSASSLLQTAKAERWSKHMSARARAERYAGQLASYRACPPVYAAQLYFDTLKDLLTDARVYIVADDAEKLWIEVDGKDAGVSGNLFDKLKTEPK